MTSPWMSSMSMTAATISRHMTLTRAHHVPVALSGTEGAAVVDARMRTNLSRLKSERTSLDGPVVNGDRENQRALGIRGEGYVVGAITIVRHLNG